MSVESVLATAFNEDSATVPVNSHPPMIEKTNAILNTGSKDSFAATPEMSYVAPQQAKQTPIRKAQFNRDESQNILCACGDNQVN